MVITWFPPVDNLFVSPGSPLQVQTNFLGPWPAGVRWEIEVRRTNDEWILGLGRSDQVNEFTTMYPFVFIQPDATKVVQWYEQPPAAAATAQSARLTVRLVDQNNLVVDQDTVPVQWRADPISIAWLQSLAATSGTGGFTSTDRSVLNAVLPAVRTLLPAALPGGPQLLMQAIDLVRGPPRSLLRPFGSQLISGRGSLSAQPTGALYSYGGTWQVAVIPAGYGKDDGQVTEWNRRIGQLVVIREGASDDLYIDVLEDTHRGNDFILWQVPNPSQINYDIAPGVTLLWEWLV